MTELSGKVEELLREAGELAATRGHAVVGTEHVLLAITRQSEDSFARRLLDEVGATEPLRSRLEAAANALDTDLTSDLGTMIERTEAELAAVVKKLQALPA